MMIKRGPEVNRAFSADGFLISQILGRCLRLVVKSHLWRWTHIQTFPDHPRTALHSAQRHSKRLPWLNGRRVPT
jgi:hypothetical protein